MSLELSAEQLQQIARQFGTPVYVYHAERIKEQYNKLLAAFDGVDTKFFYAAKALTNINVLKYILSIGCNIDCSSVNSIVVRGLSLAKIKASMLGIRLEISMPLAPKGEFICFTTFKFILCCETVY